MSPSMDFYAGIDLEVKLPDDIAWFSSCLKEIDVWLEQTYQGSKKQIWSGNKWISGIFSWLFRSRNKRPRVNKASSLSVDTCELEKAQNADLEAFQKKRELELNQAIKEAKALYDAIPTKARDLNLGILRSGTYEEAMEELRRRIKEGEINQSLCGDIQADSELSELFQLIATSGYFENINRGDYG